MPKKDKRVKNNHAGQNSTRELILADKDQTYGNVSKSLGNRWFDVECQDSILRKCQVRGSMRNRKFVNIGDVVIFSLRDFQDNKADIVHVYNGDEVRTLKKMGEFLLDLKGQLSDTIDEDEDGFDFESI